MFLSGEVCPSAPSCNLGWSGAALRVVTDGAEVSRGHSTHRDLLGGGEGLNVGN